MKPVETLTVHDIPIPDRWTLHTYYAQSPYAPDGSGRLLLAGGDLKADRGELIILNTDRQIETRFANEPLTPPFYHSAYWQAWGTEARYVFYQSGTLRQPEIVRHDLTIGEETSIPGDMEMVPADGKPFLNGMSDMLYAAGAGDGTRRMDELPIRYQDREQHGLFSYSFDPPGRELVLSVAEVLEQHPQRDAILQADRAIKARFGDDDCLTLTLYAVRYSNSGERILFYFGNHTVWKRERGEPKIGTVFTANRDLSDMQMAVDLSFDKRGNHWGWHPDERHILGYCTDPDQDGKATALMQVDTHDVGNMRRLSYHATNGHPSISPTNQHLLVSDSYSVPGEVVFIDIRSDTTLATLHLPRTNTENVPPGRNRHRVDHHPVFNPDGSRVLINTLPGELAVVAEIEVPEDWR